MNSCGMMNFVVVPRPPDFVSPRASLTPFSRLPATSQQAGGGGANSAAQSQAAALARQEQLAREQAQANASRMNDELAALRAVQYNADTRMWFDPVRGGWTSQRPANAPPGMGPQ
jgi:hypothetical protein